MRFIAMKRVVTPSYVVHPVNLRTWSEMYDSLAGKLSGVYSTIDESIWREAQDSVCEEVV